MFLLYNSSPLLRVQCVFSVLNVSAVIPTQVYPFQTLSNFISTYSLLGDVLIVPTNRHIISAHGEIILLNWTDSR